MSGSDAAERLLDFTNKNRCLPLGFSDPDKLLNFVNQSIEAGRFPPALELLEWVKPLVAADVVSRPARLDRLTNVASRMIEAKQFAKALDLLKWVEPQIDKGTDGDPQRLRLELLGIRALQRLELLRIRALRPEVEAEGKKLLAKMEEVFQSVKTGGKIPARFADRQHPAGAGTQAEGDAGVQPRQEAAAPCPTTPQGAVHASRHKLIEQLALCTYKDPDLPADERFDAAFRTLRKLAGPGTIDDFSRTADPSETYGIAGTIFKYKWNFDGNRRNLERSLGYYRRSYSQSYRGHALSSAWGRLSRTSIRTSLSPQSARWRSNTNWPRSTPNT